MLIKKSPTVLLKNDNPITQLNQDKEKLSPCSKFCGGFVCKGGWEHPQLHGKETSTLLCPSPPMSLQDVRQLPNVRSGNSETAYVFTFFSLCIAVVSIVAAIGLKQLDFFCCFCLVISLIFCALFLLCLCFFVRQMALPAQLLLVKYIQRYTLIFSPHIFLQGALFSLERGMSLESVSWKQSYMVSVIRKMLFPAFSQVLHVKGNHILLEAMLASLLDPVFLCDRQPGAVQCQLNYAVAWMGEYHYCEFNFHINLRTEKLGRKKNPTNQN